MNKDYLIAEKMQKAVQENIFPGGVLLCSKKGEIIFKTAVGQADIFSQKNVSTDSIFDLASLTKPLATTLAAAKLMESYPDLLEMPVSKIVTALNRPDKNQITVEMLLNHTSGYPAHRNFFKKIDLKNPDPRKELRGFLTLEELESLPGKAQVYSDIGYMVLSWVIETISGMRLDNFLYEKVYSPLKIESLFFIPLNEKKTIYRKYKNRLVSTQQCAWRKKLLTGEVEDENAWAAGGIEGHAGLFGDVFSVHRLCKEILSALQKKGSLLFDPDVIQKLSYKRKDLERTAGFDTPSPVGSSSGRFFSPASIGHLGFTGTSFWIDPESSVIVILLTNRVHPSRENDQIKKFRPQIHDLVMRQLG